MAEPSRQEVEAVKRILYSTYAEASWRTNHTVALEIIACLDAVRAEMKPDAERDELRRVLRRARGWVITCSESAKARADLRAIDAVLVGADHSADAGKAIP